MRSLQRPKLCNGLDTKEPWPPRRRPFCLCNCECLLLAISAEPTVRLIVRYRPSGLCGARMVGEAVHGAVDGVRSAVSRCHGVVALKPTTFRNRDLQFSSLRRIGPQSDARHGPK